MTTSISPAVQDERDRYPLHEEDNVSETDPHEQAVRYLRGAIAAYSDEWRVCGNVGIYWKPKSYEDYAAPDVFVVREPRSTPYRRTYLTWKDPAIAFVAEVASRATAHLEETSRLDTYQEILRVPEHLYIDMERGQIRLRRLGTQGYQLVEPENNGRLRSQELGLEFGFDRLGMPRVYQPGGDPLLSHEEEVQARQDVERRAEALVAEWRDAERRAFAEATDRREAEILAAREERQRRAAEVRATEEARERQAAETRATAAEARAAEEAARAAELERRLAELQEELRKRPNPADA